MQQNNEYFKLTRWNYHPKVYFDLSNSITLDRNTMRYLYEYQEYQTLHWTMNDEVVYISNTSTFYALYVFSSTGQRPVELMRYPSVRRPADRPAVCPSLNNMLLPHLLCN